MEDIIKIVIALKEPGLLISVSKTNENEAKEQEGVFLRMLLGTLQGVFYKGSVCVWYDQKRAYFSKFRAIQR